MGARQRVRGVWDITLAVDLYLRSDYYTNDERWEVTGRQGFARVNRCTGRGIQQPSLEVYADGELRAYHALDDDWASSFRDSGRHWLRWLRTGEGPLLWGADEAIEVLRFALAAYASSDGGRHRGRPGGPRAATVAPSAGRRRPPPPAGTGPGMTGGPFAEATAVTPAGPSAWQGEIRPGWDIGGNANGGYLLAIGARALLAATGRPTRSP